MKTTRPSAFTVRRAGGLRSPDDAGVCSRVRLAVKELTDAFPLYPAASADVAAD